MYIEHDLYGEYEIHAEGACQLAIKDGPTTTLHNNSITATLGGYHPIIIAQPDTTLPDWSQARREFLEAKHS